MNIGELHTRALEIVDNAFIEKFRGEIENSTVLFKEALVFEKQAALKARDQKLGEPSESVLFRSAASIALNSRDLREAEKLVALGLAGDPPHEIAEELRNLLEEINFNRHLDLQGISLDESEIQMVIAGKSIGYGLAKSNEIIDRLNVFEKLTFRTAERKLGKPFRDRGSFTKDVKESFQSYLSVPRAASFAFTLKLGKTTNQLRIPGTENAIEIIDDIVNNISLLNEGRIDDLREKIPDNIYRRNFIGLVKELAPDGNMINLIGLTFIRNGKENRIQFTRTKSEFNDALFEVYQESPPDSRPLIEETRTEVIGTLSAADSDINKITIKEKDTNTKIQVVVPEGLGDIVKTYFEEIVKISGYKNNQEIIRLISLEPM